MSNLFLFLVILSLNIDDLGIWANTKEIEKGLGTAVFVLAFVALRWKERWGKVIIFIGILCFPFLFQQFDVTLPAALAGLLCFAAINGEMRQPFLMKISAIALVLAYFKLGISLSSIMKNSLDWLSSVITSRLTFGIPMGSSLTGWVAFLFSVAIVALTCRPWKSLLKRLGIVIGAYLGVVNVIAWSLVAMPHVGLQLLWLYPVTQWLALFNIFAQDHTRGRNAGVVGRLRSASVLGFAFVACTVFASLYTPQKLPEESTSIALVNAGFLVDFEAEVPTDEPFGYGTAGIMFAMVPDYLDAFGFQVYITPSLKDVVWETTDIVVLVSLNEEFDTSFAEDIAEYVKRGGSLCIVGDHTDIEGTTTVMNVILRRFGITLNNDTADPILHFQGKSWTNALNFKNDLITRAFKDNTDVQVWGGASLSIGPWAKPIVTGKYGFSDAADPLNVGYGARLGNRRLERGERAGDVLLVAVANFGKGRIAVFGDTSPFQHPAISTNWLFLTRLFWWLTAEDIIPHSEIVRLLAYFLGLAAAVLLVLSVRVKTVLVLSLAFLLSLLLADRINAVIGETYDRAILEKIQNERIAIIDTSLQGDLDLSLLSPKSGAGLAYNLMRNGFVAIFADYCDYYREIDPALIFIVAPTKGMSLSYTATLIDFVERGGILFVSAGWERRGLVRHLLAQFDISIQPVMLGPVPWRHPSLLETQEIDSPDFKEAWPIHVLNPENTSVYYAFEEYALVTITKKGTGKLVFIGDSRFFHSDNLEEELRGKPHNVRFFRDLLMTVMKDDA